MSSHSRLNSAWSKVMKTNARISSNDFPISLLSDGRFSMYRSIYRNQSHVYWLNCFYWTRNHYSFLVTFFQQFCSSRALRSVGIVTRFARVPTNIMSSKGITALNRRHSPSKSIAASVQSFLMANLNAWMSTPIQFPTPPKLHKWLPFHHNHHYINNALNRNETMRCPSKYTIIC